MLRRFLIILVCWPLLMPQGFCICRLEAFLPQTAERLVAAEGQDQAVTPKPKCRCCRPADDAPCVESESCRAKSTPTTPSPNEHAPGCPASPHWEAARVSLHAADGFDLADSLSDPPVACWGCTAQAGHASVPVARHIDHLAAPSLYSCNFRC